MLACLLARFAPAGHGPPWNWLPMTQKLLNYDVIGKLGVGAKSTIYAVVDPRVKYDNR